jgi:hypothetical protein
MEVNTTIMEMQPIPSRKIGKKKRTAVPVPSPEQKRD